LDPEGDVSLSWVAEEEEEEEEEEEKECLFTTGDR
jgi:hypothetical protein